MEFDLMNKTMRIILILAAAAFIASGGGCASLDPDNFLPKSIAPAGKDNRFGGSVNVQAALPNVSRGKFLLSADGSQAVVPDTKRGKMTFYHSGMLRGALEKALAQHGLFQRTGQGDADLSITSRYSNRSPPPAFDVSGFDTP